MTDFRLNLNSSLVSISSPCVEVTLRGAQSGDKTSRESQSSAVLKEIGNSYSKIAQSLTERLDAMKSEVAELAIEIARSVLNDDELIDRRVQEYVVAAFDEMRPSVPEAVFVHPSCIETIKKWLEESGNKRISVSADEAISPGDCRVETGTSGVIAELDAFLQDITNQLSGNRNE